MVFWIVCAIVSAALWFATAEGWGGSTPRFWMIWAPGFGWQWGREGA